MPLDRAWMLGVIPHQGRMCLLDEVLDWSADHIRSRSATHRDPDHPLRSHGRLGSACGVEYAAQTMALHGALLAGAGIEAPGPRGHAGPPAAGFLASVRNARFHVIRLDDVADDLVCLVRRVAGDATSALYDFELRSGTTCLLDGRATVVLDAGNRLTP